MSQTQGALLLRHIRRLATAQSPSRHADGQFLRQFIAERDEAAFTALVQRHGAMVLGVCRSVLGHQQDAEDAFQATFLVLARKAAAIRKRQSVSSWLHGVAYRLALKARAQAGKRRAHVELAERADPANAMDDLTWRELRGILHEELQRLPDKYRAPLLLCYWEGKTRDEAAEQLGWAKGTLKEQLERARNLLRGRLKRRGLAPSAVLFASLLSQSGLQAAMPAGLVENTVTAAVQFGAGKAAATGAATLAQGVIHTMHVTHLAKMVSAVVVLAALGVGLGLVTRAAMTAEPSNGNANVSAAAPRPSDAKPVPDTAQKPDEELLRGRCKVKANENAKDTDAPKDTPLTVTIKPQKNRIRADEPFDVDVRVVNSSKLAQSFRVMSGSWAGQWKSNNERVYWDLMSILKNVEQKVILEPGKGYEKTGAMRLRAGKPQEKVSFKLGFTPIGSKQTYWSNEVTIQVVGELTILEVPRPNSGNYTTEEATTLLPKTIAKCRAVDRKNALVAEWKNPTHGFRVHVKANNDIETVNFFGEKQAGMAGLKSALQLSEGMLRGNPLSVLLTSDTDGWQTDTKQQILKTLFQPSIQLYIVIDKVEPDDASAAKPKDNKDLLQGTWNVVEVEVGEPREAKEANKGGQILVITGDLLTIKYDDGSTKEMIYQIDPKQKPKAIDLGPVAENEGYTLKGIYELDGDRLKLYYTTGERPTRFDPKDEDRGIRQAIRRFVLKRAPAAKAPDALTVTAKSQKNQVQANQDFKVDLRVVNSSKSPLSVRVMRGRSWQHWKSSNKPVSVVGLPSSEAFEETVKLDPGDAYEKTLWVRLGDAKPQEKVSFKLGFTPIGSRQTHWSNEITVQVEPEAKADENKKAAGEEDEKLKELKRLIIDVERIRRLESDEQKKEVERLYRTLAPRARDFMYHLRQREVEYIKDRDKQTPEAWVEKAWTSFPDAFMYLQWDARAECYAILKKQRAVLRPLIVADLASKNDKEVKWALQVVAEVGGKEFFEPVLEAFKKNPACSDAAIYALRGIDDPRAIAPLVERHADLLAVSSVLRSLQRKRPADPAVVARLDSKDAKVRSYAAAALAESGDPALVGRIEKLLRDEDPQVRSGAANMGLCLEKEAYQRIRPAIVALAKDPDAGVKKFVVMCLAQRRDPACGPALLEMARDTKLTQQEHYEVVNRIHDLAPEQFAQFGFDTSATGWRPDTPKNQEALRRFAEWVQKNSGPEKK